MNIKTFLILFLLFALFGTPSCSSTQPGQTPATVEDAEKMLAKQAKANAKKAKKEQKAAQKHFWSLQLKELESAVANLDYSDEQKSQEILTNYNTTKEQLDQEMLLWEELTEKIMGLD